MRSIKVWAVMAGLIIAVLLTSQLTKATRLAHIEQQRWQFLEQLLPNINYRDAQIKPTANDALYLIQYHQQTIYIVLLKEKGFMGLLELALAVRPDGTLINVIVLNHQETASYTGDMQAFIAQFLQHNALASDTRFDQISRASVTARALSRSIEQALFMVKSQQDIYENQ